MSRIIRSLTALAPAALSLLTTAALAQSPGAVTPTVASGDRVVDGGTQPHTEVLRVGELFEVPVRPPALSIFRAPLPRELSQFIRDTPRAIALGKALFWDMSVGSDGKTACASCHYHAGADARERNQDRKSTRLNSSHT